MTAPCVLPEMCSQSSIKKNLMLIKSAVRLEAFVCELGNGDVSNHTTGALMFFLFFLMFTPAFMRQNKCSITCQLQLVTVKDTKA